MTLTSLKRPCDILMRERKKYWYVLFQIIHQIHWYQIYNRKLNDKNQGRGGSHPLNGKCASKIHSLISYTGSFYVIMEYASNGDLRNFLRKSRKVRNNVGKDQSYCYVSNLSPNQLQNFAIGVAKAMMHISSVGVRIM